MPSVISGDANVSATEFGYLDGVTSALQTQMDSKLPIAGGKILQIVRATDATNRSTTSGAFVDASISVTITPQKSDSAILLMWTGRVQPSSRESEFQITDSSNNAISGAEQGHAGQDDTVTFYATQITIGWATPATTSAVTYKLRFRQLVAGTNQIFNAVNTGQMFAIEVSA